MKGICVIPTLIAGKFESRYLSTVVSFREHESLFNSVSVVTYYPDCAKVFSLRHLEHRINAADKVKVGTLLSNKYKNCSG